MIRNRIVEHVRIRAGELVPHPYNYRRHPARQRAALASSLQEVGFARSLLGHRLPDGRIQLIDGHLRRDLHPDLEVTVEVLDVTADEARKLLLTMDPLAALAEADAEVLQQLRRITEADAQVLNDFWDQLAARGEPAPAPADPATPDRFLILIECRDEAQQVELLERLQADGIACKAIVG
jgi:hypothetical protein